MEKQTLFQREIFRRHRAAVLLGAAVLLLALIETVNAFVAPSRAPREEDWKAAAGAVRAGFRQGDLIVTAPDFADPILRLHLGDLLPQPVLGRMDAMRFGRIWEISQRGARADEVQGQRPVWKERHGALTVSRFERPAAQVTYDFFTQWREGRLTVVTTDGREIPCPLAADRHQCVEGPVFLRPQLLEIDTRPRATLSTLPVDGNTTVFDYSEVLMGRELAVGAGLHNVWLRKAGEGVVRVRVLVNGKELGMLEAKSLSGFSLQRFDTVAWAGQTVQVRFAITTNRAASRHLGFVAEARNP